MKKAIKYLFYVTFFALLLATSLVFGQTKNYDELYIRETYYIISGIEARTGLAESSGNRNIYEKNKEQQKYEVCPYWIAQLLVKNHIASGGVDPFSIRFVSKCPKAVEIHSACNNDEEKALTSYDVLKTSSFLSFMLKEPKMGKGSSYCRICHTVSLKTDVSSNLDYRLFFRYRNP